MHVGYCALQYARPPYLAGPRRFEDAVAWRVAFNSDRVKPIARILDREVQTEGAAIVRIGRLPSLAAKEFFHGVAEPVAFGCTRIAFEWALVTRRPSSARPESAAPSETVRAYSR